MSANDLSTSLLKVLHLPENTCEFTLSAKAGQLVIIKGTFHTTKGDLEEFERVFKDRAELVVA